MISSFEVGPHLDLIIDCFFQGAIWILLLYNLLLYLYSRQKFTLSYAAYLFFISLNFINVRTHFLSREFLTDIPIDMALKFEAFYFESFLYISYFYFLRHYLDADKSYPSISKLLRVMIINSTLEIVLTNTMLATGHPELLLKLVTCLKITNMICAIILIPLFYKAFNKLIKYIFIGGVFLLLGTICYFTQLHLQAEPSFWQPHYSIYLAILIEILIFSLGIGYRFRLIEDEKHTFQARLILELQAKEEYQHRLKNEMQRQLETQTELIRTQTAKMFQVELNQELAETKMKLLTARMNPHFLFNSLNSVKDLMVKGKSATKYLDKFASLLRGILMQSGQKTISLEEELNTLKNYLALENLRFDNSISYDFILGDMIAKDYIRLPPMLLQPIVENAIWHGLRPKKDKEKQLTIQCVMKEQIMEVSITDNGVGRDLQKISNKKHKSLGMELVSRRLKLFNQDHYSDSDLNIIDRFDEEGLAIGTSVIMRLFVGD